MINTDITVVLVALSTAATIMMIGLGFLPYPSRATAIWSIAFATAMVATYLAVAADALGSLPLRTAVTGPILATTGLLWVGLRARRKVEPVYVVPVVLLFTALTLALGLTATTPWIALVLRITFLAGGIFAGLAAVELLRIRGPHRDITLPLAIVSIGFSGLAALVLFDAVVRAVTGTWAEAEGDILTVRTLNVIAASVYLLCGLVTLLGIVRAEGRAGIGRPLLDFTHVAQDRLDRARDTRDSWWSLLDIRLDDPGDLLQASSAQEFARVVDRFQADVRAALPTEADLDQVSPTRVVALVPRPDAAVRTLMSQLLDRLSTIADGQAIPVRLSASIGVASVTVAGHDITRLRAAAASAADHAQIAGGDRWERAVFAG